ncbi:G-protein coupled receptor family C group 6 member A-like [Heptranchias perlo]|uniref:G-protein coupled receptor family C group 6 member A-like n=1 Tax=Heptranchias perlo TaxID=212740 RepID=UPI00355AA1B4
MSPLPVTFIVSFLIFFHPVRLCNIPDDIVGARAPGDIIIGGLFPVHEKVESLANRTQPGPLHCSGFDIRGFVRASAMIYTVDVINNSPLLPGVRLGYEIYDSCADSTKAIKATMRFLSALNSADNHLDVRCNYSDYIPVVKAVVGDGYSEVSIPVARIMNRYLMPQISYASSAEILSDKVRFASFFRTIPSDVHQTEALAAIVNHFNWNWVGAIATDDDYGQAAVDSFISNADKFKICIHFRELIPSYVNHQQSDEIISKVAETVKNSSAEVIILIAKIPIVIKLFTILIKQNVSKIWIATDVWSNSRQVATMDQIGKVGNIFGLSFKNGNIAGFTDYLKKLNPGPDATNKFIEEYKKTHFACLSEFINDTNACKLNSQNCTLPDSLKVVSSLACTNTNETVNDDFFIKNTERGGAYAAYLAVKAIANALQKLLNCQKGTCDTTFEFPPWKLLKELKNISFVEGDGEFKFNEAGDSTDGYDLLNWKVVNGSAEFNVVGEYRLATKKIYISDHSFQNAIQNIFSNCSKSCKAGKRKKPGTPVCCYECVPCERNHFSSQNDMAECHKCPKEQWSPENSIKCIDKTIEILQWTDSFAIALIAISAFGVLVIFTMAVIFTKNLDTPAVKAAGGKLCYVILISLVLSFGSVGFFVAEPTDRICKIRQPAFGISFTLCMSCILVKTFRIILAFKFKPSIHGKLVHLHKPVLIILVGTGIQVIICTLWQVFKGSQPEKIYDVKKIFLRCNEGSYTAFGAMIGYLALLACLCFTFAFKGRKLPENYNEARFITFSMLIYLIVWISFIIVYININLQGSKYVPTIEIVAILASNYGILCCHFIPVGYIVCLRKKKNTEESYRITLHKNYKTTKHMMEGTQRGKQRSNNKTGSPGSLPLVSPTSPTPYQNIHNHTLQSEQNPRRTQSFVRKRRASY